MRSGDPAAGWYADPWGVALLRWWDGATWTGHVLDQSQLPPPGPEGTSNTTSGTSATPSAGAYERIAVVDVETTGLFNSDRVVEVAVVTVDRSGLVVDEFETLVNPGRDVGPTWLHQVSASMVVGAPAFDDVAHHVAARLDGAVVAAHNLPFDRRVLTHELGRSGIDIDWGTGFDTLSVTGCKLGAACAERGIALTSAHCALADARATAQLLAHTMSAFDGSGSPAVARPLQVTPIRVHTRTGAIDAPVPAPYLAALASGMRTAPDLAPYMDLLEQVVADLQITDDERHQLRALAGELGLDDLAVARAHRDFLNGLVDAALADLVITEEEHDLLCRAAALLAVDPEIVAQRTYGYRASASEVSLVPGLRVCFTGAATDLQGRKLERSYLEDLARGRSLTPTKSVTASGCDLLVAADPSSRSGKAGKARQFGVPIVSVADFLAARSPDDALAASQLVKAGVALVCTRCGTSWMAPRRSATPVCGGCRSIPRSSPSAPVDAPRTSVCTADAHGVPELETLTCTACGSTWERQRVGGRKPHRCPNCA